MVSSSLQEIKIRKSADRGHIHWEWLDSRHTFSFAEYQDPKHTRFRTLRVINEDVIQAGQGFDTHPHRDMEILTYVIDGELKHRDSMGNGSMIKAGEFQRMSAGTGVEHSEYNPSKTKPVHLLQIWIFPDQKNINPSYEQLPSAQLDEPIKGLKLAADSRGSGCLLLHQDVRVYLGELSRNEKIKYAIDEGRGLWVQMIHGELSVQSQTLMSGDGLSVERLSKVEMRAKEQCRFILFDLG